MAALLYYTAIKKIRLYQQAETQENLTNIMLYKRGKGKIIYTISLNSFKIQKQAKLR